MKTIILSLLLFTAMASLSAQSSDGRLVAYPGGKTYMYRITFRDKVGTTGSIAQPEKFLSKRALQRRTKQKLIIDSTDLPVSEVYLRQIRKSGVKIVALSKWNNTALVRGNNIVKLEALAALPFVVSNKQVFASPDSIRPQQSRVKFQDRLMLLDSIATDYYGIARRQIEGFNGRQLHNHGFTGKGISIAVLDAGFMNVDRMPTFANVNILGTRNFVSGTDNDNDVFRHMDHGTKTLSTMAVNQPSVFVGTAPQAGYWLLRCEDFITETQAEEDFWAAGVEFADSVGADIISSSLGYHYFDDKRQNYSYIDLDGRTALISRTASMLARKGIVLVNSAGNDGMGTWKKISVPADAPDILTVGAIAPDSLNAAFSSVGPTTDGRVKPDVMAFGCPTSVVSGRGFIIQDTGTSFACPLVAGMVACLWQALPQKTALEIIDIVRSSANRKEHPDNVFGYGIPDFWKAYQSNRSSTEQ